MATVCPGKAVSKHMPSEGKQTNQQTSKRYKDKLSLIHARYFAFSVAKSAGTGLKDTILEAAFSIFSNECPSIATLQPIVLNM